MIEPTPEATAFKALEKKMPEARIKEIKDTIGTLLVLWVTYPDLRLGQLLANVLDPSGAVDYYYYEDAEIREIFKDWPKKEGKNE